MCSDGSVIYGFRYFKVWLVNTFPHIDSARENSSPRFREMVKLTFYYKGSCWLCDTAQEMLNGLSDRYDIRTNKIAIDSDDELYELYRFDIPVLEFRDGSTLNGRIRRKDLIKKLEENQE